MGSGCSRSVSPETAAGGRVSERTERTYGAWAQAEEHDEQDYLVSQKTAVTVQQKLEALHPEKHEARKARRRASLESGNSGGPPPKHYTGPHVQPPYTLEQADELLDFFVLQPRTGFDILHLSYVKQLLSAGTDLFAALPTVVQIGLPSAESGDCLIVVGDTHGQLSDVLHIFAEHGAPSEHNVYLFNGDIADRGACACEILLLLLAYKLACPSCVHINRGNHESAGINERPAQSGGGFAAEVRAKYGREAFHLFQALFCSLPLGAQLGEQVLVLHGGLSRLGAGVARLRAVHRQMQCPDLPVGADETILFDSLWADPSAEGEPPGSGRGGVCHSWDEAATSAFLAQNGLSLLVRSHQLPRGQRGYMLHHSNQVLTVFSASNYCGVAANHGAVLLLSGGRSEVWEFEAPRLDQLAHGWEGVRAERTAERARRRAEATGRALSPMRRTTALSVAFIARTKVKSRQKGGGAGRVAGSLVQGPLGGQQLTLSEAPPTAANGGVARMDVSVVRGLKERICMRRADLLALFRAADAERSGLLPLARWQELVGQALGVAIDWGLYSQLLVTPQRPEAAGGVPGLVAYVGSLDRYQIRLRPEYAGWQAGVLSAAYGRLQAADLSLDALTAQFDANRDGQVTAAELLAVLRSLRLPLSGPQLERALLWMGVGNGWRFEAGSFLSQLHVMMRHDAPAAPAAAGGEGGEKGGGEGVEKGGGAVLLSDGSSLDGVAFVSALLCQLADTDHDGQLSASELHAASEGLWRLIDADGDGYLSYAEFADALLRLLAEGGHPRQPSLALAPGAALSREHALRLAARIDVCGTGRICFLDFLPLLTSAGGALHGSNSALIQHICTHIFQQQQPLAQAFAFFDRDEDGTVAPAHFVQAVAMVGEVISGGRAEEEPFTSEQIEILAVHCPKGEGGKINYNAFLAAFVVVDTLAAETDDARGATPLPS